MLVTRKASDAFVVRRHSIIPHLVRSLGDAIPLPLRRLWAGPHSTLRISPTLAEFVGARRSGRPVDVLLSPDMVLVRRLTLPAAGSEDIRSSVELMISAETPFTANELVVYIDVQESDSGADALDCTVHMAPRAQLLRVLTQNNVPLRSIRQIAPDITSPASFNINFLSAFTSARRYRQWLVTLPILVIIAGLGAVASSELEIRQATVARLTDALDSRTKLLRSMNDGLANIELAAADGAALDAALASALPAIGPLLPRLGNALADSTELLRVDIRGRQIRLAMQTPDTLGEVRRLGQTFVGWTVEVDGAISANATDGGESAVVLLTASPGQLQ